MNKKTWTLLHRIEIEDHQRFKKHIKIKMTLSFFWKKKKKLEYT